MCKLKLNLDLIDPNFHQHCVHLLSWNALLTLYTFEHALPLSVFVYGIFSLFNPICMLIPIYPSQFNTSTISPLHFSWIPSSPLFYQNEVAVFPLYF